MLAHPHGRQLSQRPHLRVRDRLERMTKAQSAAAFHLAEDQRQSADARLRRNNVDLTQPAAPVPLEDLHALPSQFGARQVFATYPDLLLRFRRRHRPPPYESMRTPTRIVRARRNLWKPPIRTLWKTNG